jgi:acyl-CoA-binding protein
MAWIMQFNQARRRGEMMSDLHKQFEAAAEAAKSLTTKPDNETLLQLYALYKQATAGDAGGKRPGFTDFVGRAKYDAWAKLQGTPQAAAMQRYVDLVAKLQKA